MNEFFILEKKPEGETVCMKKITVGQVEIPLTDLNPDPEQYIHAYKMNIGERVFQVKQTCKRKRIITKIIGPVKWGGTPLSNNLIDGNKIALTSDTTVGDSLMNKGGERDAAHWVNLSDKSKKLLSKHYMEFHLDEAELTITQSMGASVEFRLKVAGRTPHLPNVHNTGKICSGKVEFNKDQVMSARALLLGLEANPPNHDLLEAANAEIQISEKKGLLYGKPKLR